MSTGSQSQDSEIPSAQQGHQLQLLVCGSCSSLITDQTQLSDHMRSHVVSALADAKAHMSRASAGDATASKDSQQQPFKAVVCYLKVDARHSIFCSVADAPPAAAAAASASIPDEAILSRQASAFNANVNVLSLSIALGKWQRKRAFECRFCGQRFRLRLAAVDHVNLHTDHRPYKCRYCPAVCHSSPARCVHERRQHPDRLGGPGACGDSAASAPPTQAPLPDPPPPPPPPPPQPQPQTQPQPQPQLQPQLQPSAPVPCGICGVKCPDARQLQHHLQVHQRPPPPPPRLLGSLQVRPVSSSSSSCTVPVVPALCHLPAAGNPGAAPGAGHVTWRPIQLRPGAGLPPTGFRPILPRPTPSTQMRIQLPSLLQRK